jgi:hypothetical protein
MVIMYPNKRLYRYNTYNRTVQHYATHYAVMGSTFPHLLIISLT